MYFIAMNKKELLSTLTVNQLKEIIALNGLENKNKGLKKNELVDLISEKVKMEDIHNYVDSISEKKNKAKEESPGQKPRTEKSKIEGPKNEEKIVALQREKIHRIVIDAVCNAKKEPLPKSTGIDFYDKLSDSVIDRLYSAFVLNKDDQNGEFNDMRVANALVYKEKEIGALRLGHKIGEREFRILGFDISGLPYVMGITGLNDNFEREIGNTMEAAKRLLESNSKEIAKKYREVWIRTIFISDRKNSSFIEKEIRKVNGIASNGVLKIKRGFFKPELHIRDELYIMEDKKLQKII